MPKSVGNPSMGSCIVGGCVTASDATSPVTDAFLRIFDCTLRLAEMHIWSFCAIRCVQSPLRHMWKAYELKIAISTTKFWIFGDYFPQGKRYVDETPKNHILSHSQNSVYRCIICGHCGGEKMKYWNKYGVRQLHTTLRAKPLKKCKGILTPWTSINSRIFFCNYPYFWATTHNTVVHIYLDKTINTYFSALPRPHQTAYHIDRSVIFHWYSKNPRT